MSDITDFAWFRMERDPICERDYLIVLYNRNGLRKVRSRRRNVYQALDSLQGHVKFKERMNGVMSGLVAKLQTDPLARKRLVSEAKQNLQPLFDEREPDNE